MNTPLRPKKETAKSSVASVRERLETGKQVRRTLSNGDYLHMDRPLPFLCVYRSPVDHSDAGTNELLQGEASFLFTTGDKRLDPNTAALVKCIAEVMSAKFGAFLIVEIWASHDGEVATAAKEDDITQTELQPNFVVTVRGAKRIRRTVGTLVRSLKRIAIARQQASLRVDPIGVAHPTGTSYMLSDSVAKRLRCETVGIAVRPIYRDHRTQEVFPVILHTLKRRLGVSLKQTFFSFAKWWS